MGRVGSKNEDVFTYILSRCSVQRNWRLTKIITSEDRPQLATQYNWLWKFVSKEIMLQCLNIWHLILSIVSLEFHILPKFYFEFFPLIFIHRCLHHHLQRFPFKMNKEFRYFFFLLQFKMYIWMRFDCIRNYVHGLSNYALTPH